MCNMVALQYSVDDVETLKEDLLSRLISLASKVKDAF